MAGIVFVTCMNCTFTEKDSARISFSLPTGTEIEVSNESMFDFESMILADKKVDFSGKCSMDLAIDGPTLANLRIDQEISTLYIEPGYDLHISFSKDTTIQYSGIGSQANNYLRDIFFVRSKLEQAGGKSIYELNQQAFLQRLDSLVKAMDNFHRTFNDKNQLPKSVSELFEKRNKIIALVIKQAYGWNYGIRNSTGIPDNLSIVNRIPFDSIMMKSGMSEYATVLHLNLNLKYYHPLISNKTEAENKVIFDKVPMIVEAKILNETYPDFVRELYLAKNVEYFLSLIGISPSSDTIYNHFKQRYPASPYLVPIKKRYDKWLAISEGKVAPNVVGFGLDGTKHSLNELKGKVVYIDVWATWCGPCIAEFPYAKKLNKIFKNEKIVFLYVSVDVDQNAWRKMIQTDQYYWGLHIIETKEAKTPIREAYEISGIPRFILVDEKGLILNADAPRPSSVEIVDEINKALNRRLLN